MDVHPPQNGAIGYAFWPNRARYDFNLGRGCWIQMALPLNRRSITSFGKKSNPANEFWVRGSGAFLLQEPPNPKHFLQQHKSSFALQGPPVVPFLIHFWGRVPQLKEKNEKNEEKVGTYPDSNLSTGGASLAPRNLG